MTTRFTRGVTRRTYKRFATLEARFKNVVAHSEDLGTGVVTRQYAAHAQKVIGLPVRLARDFVYDLSFIAANKNFTYGGSFEAEQVDLIVNMALVPVDFKIEKETVVILRGKPYMVHRIIGEWGVDQNYIVVRVERTGNPDLTQLIVEPAGAASAVAGGVDPTVVIT